MAREKESVAEQKKVKNMGDGGVSSMIYGLGFIGAVVYYIQHSNNFQEGLIGFLKALVWPAFLIYRALEFLKM